MRLCDVAGQRFGRLLVIARSANSLDRKNNDGHYEPGNVRWATPREQAQNRRKPNRREKAHG